MKRRFLRWMLWSIVGILVLSTVLCWGAAILIHQTALDALHADLTQLPHHRVALVLGCSPVLTSGESNLYFKHRMTAAAAVFHAGKADYLLVSGDNHTIDYDEPTAMRHALVALGVPDERIVADYAGFSTFESMIRARDVFTLADVTIISQPDHAQRACYIAHHLGMQADIYPAQEVTGTGSLRTTIREALARAGIVLDLHVWGRSPRFLGPTIRIGQS
jgi:SanA protein